MHDDRLARTLAPLGRTSRITRASHVEPHPTRQGWLADMSPSGGPVIGANGSASLDADRLEPFETRAAALEAELTWLRDGGLVQHVARVS